MGGGQSPQEGVLPLAENLFILPVGTPNQILIPPLNNDFQVITHYKLQKTPSKIVLPPMRLSFHMVSYKVYPRFS